MNSELVLNVKPNTASGFFEFTPNRLTIKVIASDILSGYAQISYKLEDTTINKIGYDSREWPDQGNVKVPTVLLANAVNSDGSLNNVVINQFLAAFNLELL